MWKTKDDEIYVEDALADVGITNSKTQIAPTVFELFHKHAEAVEVTVNHMLKAVNKAASGKDSKADYLKSLGAKSVVNRAEFDKDPRLIDKGLWDGVVDTVGGKILANAIV